MAKPAIHARSSVRRYGGKVKDYMAIHNFLDSSKSALADSRHRSLTHTSWFLSVVLEKVFGEILINSDGQEVSVRGVGEDHVLEDLGFIPTPQDYLADMPIQDWMLGKGSGSPPSSRKIVGHTKRTRTESLDISNMVVD